MTSALMLNALAAVSVRLVTPFVGAWFADVDVDLDVPVAPSSGPAVLKIGTAAILSGTIDPRGTGRFGTKARVRVVGGGGGWDKSVVPREWQNDSPAGVIDATVIAATGVEVGELATVVTPSSLGAYYERAAGRASSVLDGRSWYVTPAGATIVGPRAELPANPKDLEVLEWDGTTQRATIGSDALVQPGMFFIDTRFGKITVRDVEQTWDEKGARAIAWCGPSSSARLAGALRAFVQASANVKYLKRYRYRVVKQGPDGRLTVQPVKVKGPMPPALALAIWPGMTGLSAKVKPGTEVHVVFEEGDPSAPRVVAFDGAPVPLELTASAAVAITLDAPMTKIGGLKRVVMYEDFVTAWTALKVALAAAPGGSIAIDALPTSVASTKVTVA